MAKTDEEKRIEFLELWDSLEETMREVASDQIRRGALGMVLDFLSAIEQIKPKEKGFLNRCRTTRSLMLQPGAHVDDEVRDEIDKFKQLAEDLENRLRRLITE